MLYLTHQRQGMVTMGHFQKFWNFSISLWINWYQWKDIDIGKSQTLLTVTALKLMDLNLTS